MGTVIQRNGFLGGHASSCWYIEGFRHVRGKGFPVRVSTFVCYLAGQYSSSSDLGLDGFMLFE